MTTYLAGPAATIPPDAGVHYPYPSGVIEGGPGGQPGELLFERSSAGGVTMRGHLQAFGEMPVPDFGIAGWEPAAWCFPTGFIRVGVTNPDVIDVGQQPWFSQPYGLVDARLLFLGAIEGMPMIGLVGLAAPTVQSVQLFSAAGVVDAAEVVDGIVALVVPGTLGAVHTVTAALTDGSTQTWGFEELFAQRAGPDHQLLRPLRRRCARRRRAVAGHPRHHLPGSRPRSGPRLLPAGRPHPSAERARRPALRPADADARDRGSADAGPDDVAQHGASGHHRPRRRLTLLERPSGRLESQMSRRLPPRTGPGAIPAHGAVVAVPQVPLP